MFHDYCRIPKCRGSGIYFRDYKKSITYLKNTLQLFCVVNNCCTLLLIISMETVGSWKRMVGCFY